MFLKQKLVLSKKTGVCIACQSMITLHLGRLCNPSTAMPYKLGLSLCIILMWFFLFVSFEYVMYVIM